MARRQKSIPDRHHCEAAVFLAPARQSLHSRDEADRDFHPRSRVKRFVQATDAKAQRRFYRGVLKTDSSGGRQAIESISVRGEEQYLNAAFLRVDESAEPVRLRTPDGFLMIFTAKSVLGGTLVAARADTNGVIIWKADTGIDRFQLSQILPGVNSVAFVRPRPQVRGMVSEPLMVIVDSRTGAVSASSLWK